MPAPTDDLRRRVGRTLDRLGLLGLPLTLGAALGFWASDQGVPLLPTMLEVLSGVCLLSVVLVGVGRWLGGRVQVDTPQGRRLRKRVVALLVIGAIAGAVRVAVYEAERPSPLTRLSPEAFSAAFSLDAQRYLDHDAAMEQVLQRIEARPWVQDAGGGPLSTEEEQLLLDAWASLWAATVELDGLRVWWEDWYRIDPARSSRDRHLQAFLLTFAAELSLHEKAARMSALVQDHREARKLLEAPRPELGLPRTSYSIYRQELLGSRDQARVLAGERYLDVLRLGVQGRAEARKLGIGWLWDAVEAHLATIEARTPIDRATLLVRADSQVLRRSLRRAWYPAQKGVAEAMGDTRTRRIGWYLVDEALQAQVVATAQPGDVLLARKNWYLSNVGLPGFWPHAILFLGSPDQLADWADTDEIRAWAETQGAPSLPALLEQRDPVAWRQYLRPVDGETPVVLEAVSEGVTFNPISHAAGDYLAVLRPRLDRLARAQAVAEAFGHVGKPYDFDFDFATDSTLVCTELVWRSYRPGPGKAGMVWPLVTLAGRPTMPANEVARLYAEEHGRPDATFDFVMFVDASEKEQRAFLSDEAAFRESHARSRWDVATIRAPDD